MIHSVFVLFPLQQVRWVSVRHDMKNTLLLIKMARSMLIAGMVLGITGVVYAQSGAGGAAVGGSSGISAGTGAAAAAGQAGSGMSGMGGALPGLEKDPSMSRALPGLGKYSSMSGRAVPGLKSSAGPQGGSAPGLDIPPGEKRTSRASSRMKESDWVGGESTGMGVGSSQD